MLSPTAPVSHGTTGGADTEAGRAQLAAHTEQGGTGLPASPGQGLQTKHLDLESGHCYSVLTFPLHVDGFRVYVVSVH